MPRRQDIWPRAVLRGRQLARLSRYLVRGRRPADIVAYRGYASASRVYLHGRVLARPTYSKGAADDPAWRNLLNTYRRMRSVPIPHAEVRVEYSGASRLARADNEGFFAEWLDLPRGTRGKPGWRQGSVSLVRPVIARAAVTVAADILVPDSGAQFGVISDIDDTVIQSHVSSFLRAARLVLLGNALTRLPFEGVAEFYRGLARGTADGPENPLFYVSSSPWNLYDVIDDFLAVQGIPHGPLLLRDWDIGPSAISGSGHHGHKEAAIAGIMDAYPALPFILIGDSAQKDPEIYARVVHDHGDRILAVYIRDVSRTPARETAMRTLEAEVQAAGSTLLLVHDTRGAAAHAAEQGWIVEEEVEAVEREAAADAGVVPGKTPPPR
jgi:phosphatidate phosphatase APP1